MRYLYGDSTPFPLGYNFLSTLEAFMTASTRIVQLDLESAQIGKQRDELAQNRVKGLEALSWECAAAAQAAGVLDEVMASLDASEKPLKWAERIAYNRERMETHGLRRAAEMEESARTLDGLGVEPVMTRGTVDLQRKAAKTNERTPAA